MKFVAAIAIVATAGVGFGIQKGEEPKPKPKVQRVETRGPIVAISPMVDFDAEYYKQAEIDAYLAAVEAERVERERQEVEAYLNALHEAEQTRLSQSRASARVSTPVYYEGGTNAHLERIKMCESGGNYAADTGNGFYGAYQFMWSTWAAVGGTGNPAQASPEEQDMRAQILYDRAGPGQWPVCQYR